MRLFQVEIILDAGEKSCWMAKAATTIRIYCMYLYLRKVAVS
jgi:hypothetical protein